MNAQDVLAALRERGIAIDIAAGDLKIRAPRGAMDAALLGAVKAHKAELIARLETMDAAARDAAGGRTRITLAHLTLVTLAQEEIDGITAAVPGGAANVGDVYPLSPLQEGILFHHLVGGEGDAYLLRSVVAFDSRARLDAFLAALQAVIDRHDILRSAVHWLGLAQPVQVVQRRAPLPLRECAFEGDVLAQLMAQTDPRRVRIDLTQAPLLAANVAFDPATGEWLLALLNHHLVCDHITLEFIVGEIRTIVEGRAAALPAPVPFRHFIAQRSALTADDHAAYFRRELGDVDETTAPFGVLDTNGDGGHVNKTNHPVADALARRIREIARSRGVAPSVLFHVAWAQVLATCCGRDDVVFGTVLSGRLQGAEGADRVLGMFLNTLPIRIATAGRTVAEAVHDTYGRLVGLLEHEQASLALAQRCSAVPQPLPLFTSLLNYRHSRALTSEDVWEGLREIAGDTRNNYPLTMSIEDRGAGFEFVALCARGIDGGRLVRQLEHVVTGLVEALERDPQRLLGELPLLDGDDIAALRELGRGPASEAYRDAMLPQQIAAQAALTPDAVAVRAGDESLSYAEFDRRTNRLAHALVEQGVERGSRVGIHLDRSIELMVALVAVMKTGAAYVMLDARQTPERLAAIVADAGICVALVDSRRSVLLVKGLDTVFLDGAGGADAWMSDYPDDTPAVTIDGDDSVYVLYTSGSTGTPKGVEIRHAGLTDYCAFARESYYGLYLHGSLVATSAAFDLTIPALYVPLLTGGCVTLMPAEDELVELARQLDGEAPASLLRLTPSHVQGVLALTDETSRDAAHVFVIGGEAFAVSLAQQLQAKFPYARIINHYGPTETVVGCAWYDVSENLATLDRTIPIGRPMSNTQIYILGNRGEIQPHGVAGELCIGGAGVAKGYVNRPELTAQKFVADPFDANARIYRSGDRARWRADGQLEFLGRLDDQVKLRGFRIELGDIESVLKRCAGVREAAAAIHGEALVAYVVGDAAVDSAKAHAAEHLPTYMQPSAIVHLNTLPLTRNGKLDRRALPAPDFVAAEFAAPQTETEIALAAIWSRVLKHAAIGRDANFFEIGGHSLLATRVASDIAKTFGKRVPVRALFEHASLRCLATHLDALAGTAYERIPAADRSAPLPLSFAQRRLWFIDRLEGGSVQYNMPVALHLRGALDVAALEGALDALDARHEVLRTTFAETDDGPVQVIAPSAGIALVREDLTGQTAAALRARIDEEASRPFDLARDPMLRCRLLRLADDEHALLVTQHHIASDGWSIGVLVEEIAALYRAFAQGTAPALAPLAVQYADYAAWQQARLQGDVAQRDLQYWRETLAGLPVVHNLPLDHPRPAQQSFEGAAIEQTIDAATLAGLHALARAHDASLFMVLDAAFAALLSRWSGETDVVIGTPIAGRLHKDIEPLIGFFVNTLVLRSDCSGDPDFGTLVDRTKAMALAAYAHQEMPFEMLVEDIRPARSLAHAPLFQVLFSMRNNALPALELPGVRLSPIASAGDTTKFDLQLSATEADGGLRLNWLYATRLFARAGIARLGDAYARLLRAVVAAPQTRLSQLPLAGEGDLALVRRWNATSRAYPRDAGIHELFEAQAARSPQRIALVHDGLRLSYRDLDARANRIAHALIARGVQTGDRVGLCVERSFDLVAGILGVLKAGAAYVPLDPALPAARLAYLVEDSGVAQVLAQAALAPRVTAASVVIVDDGSLDTCSDTKPDVRAGGDDVAFVMYTSGSTGRPKGVLQTHRTIVNLMLSLFERHAAVAAQTPTLQFAAMTFDMSLYEIANALFTGSPLVLAGDEDRLDFARLIDLLARERVGRVYLPTAMLTPFAQAVEQAGAALPDLALVQVAGEALAITPVVRAWARRSGIALLNLYGPTETHVVSDVLLDGDPSAWPALPSIGRPIGNVTLHVLDAVRQPQPVGVVGELYAAGDALARGYLQRPELDAERFVTIDIDGATQRAYRTGDLVRWRADGTLDYVGRADTQVKLRGFRIELGEIEAALSAHARVDDAVVVALGDGDEKRLVAYVVPRGSDAGLMEALRDALAAQLPTYMVPAAFVPLDRLPLTTNGKIDRRALPAPDFAPAVFVAPQTPTEIALASIWSRLLKHEPIGRDANFFDLGGHSLLATRMASEVAKAFGKPLPVRALFEHATLSRLAVHLDAQVESGYAAIPRASRDGELPLSFAQQRLWFIDRLQGGSAQYNMAAALRLRGALDIAALQAALDALVARHEVLRTTFAEVDGVAVQRIAPATAVVVAMDDARDAEALQRCIDAEAARPFDLANDFMLRCRLLRLADDEHALLLTQHHIASDGWSIGVLVEEFASLYRAFATGTSATLPPLAVQYADYAAWQRSRLQGDLLQRELSHWREALAGLPVVHNLPLDRPRPAQPSFDGARVERVLDAATLEGLHALARAHDASLFMVLEAAFAALLSRWSGETDVVIGTPIAGRLHKDVEPLIGFFVNTLVLRSDLSDDPDFVTLLARTKATSLAAYAHQEVPFEMLVEELKPARSFAHTPLFQVLFSMRNHELPALELPGLAVEPLAATADRAKFDLQLSATEADGALRLGWLYAADLFDAATVARLADALVRVLRAIVAAPATKIAALPLIDAAAVDALRDLGRGPESQAFRDATLPQQIAAQAARTPEAIAVRVGDEALSYADFDRRTNRLAHALIARGAGRGTRIGIHLDRSIALMTALVAVMKTGAAYVMLDARQTPDRLQAIVADAGVRIVLAESPVPLDGVETMTVDAHGQPDHDPAIAIDGDDSVYVLYTSGSTGTPKGVEIRHAGLTDYCAFARESYYGLYLHGSLVATSAAFDLTIPALYVPLLTGGCVTLMPAENELPELARQLDGDAPASLLRLTPSHVQGVLALTDDTSRDTAHVFVIGGEAFAVSLAQQLQAKFPYARIINHYGPTETVVGCAWYDVSANLGTLDRTIPVGRPMSNTQIYILDTNGEMQPRGVAGELCIGGAGVAKGYVNRPELTAQKFVADPFDANARIYRSGDRARWRADGQLEFLGRLDDQVKLRGFRIELGDIESVLKRCAGVRDAAAAVHGEALVAYVVGDAEAQHVKAHATEHLPSYMQPSAIVHLDALPLTRNGKLDRRALPAPDLAPVEYVPPATLTEARLVDIWRDVLGIDAVSVVAGFFELGGHSLLATRLVNAVQRRLGVELPIRSIFEKSDIRNVAAFIDAQELRQRNQAALRETTQRVEMEW